MCLTKAIKTCITWKDPLSYLHLNTRPVSVCFFLKTKRSLSFTTICCVWKGLCGGCGELGLILGGWHLSGVFWYAGLSNLLGDSFPFSLTLFIFSTPPFFPPSPLSSCIKDSYGTYSVFRILYAPPAALLFLLVHSALYLLPSPVIALSPPPHISTFPLIGILRVNPPNSAFHSGLAFSPSAKRTIGWEGQNKRPPWWRCAVSDHGACFLSFSVSLFFSPLPLTETSSLYPFTS